MPGADSLYERDGDAFVGTAATKGSWYDNGQAGGAVLALLGHVLEDTPTLVPMSVSRLTVDIVRPVPLGEPLHVDQTVLRDGKRIQLVDLTVRTGSGDVTTRARALRAAHVDITPLGGIPRPSTTSNPAATLPTPDEFGSVEHLPGVADFLLYGAEMRRSVEPIDGMHSVWLRLRVPVVAGEPVRPTSRAVLPLDIVNLIGVDDREISRISIINPDVTGHLVRYPVGEWVALTGNSYYDHRVGHGLSMGLMSDQDGVFGLTSTTQLVRPMGD